MLNKVILLVLALVGLAACSGGAASDGPASVVENYLRTRITGDAPKVIALTCKAREAEAQSEAASFSAMKAEIESLACAAGAAQGDFTVVSCKGKMVTTYNGESRDWDLGARAFKTLQEDGAWKVCGYTAAQ